MNSYQKNNRKLFSKGSFLGLRAFFFVFLSLVLIFSSQRLPYFEKVRTYLSFITMPIQYLVNLPVEMGQWAENHFKTNHNLLEENTELNSKLLFLQTKLQRLYSLEKENNQLRALLSSSSSIESKFILAQILAVHPNPYEQQVVIDKGKNQKVYNGQPVLDAYGVFGLVISSGLFVSKVLLVTSSRCAIPVEDSRSGIRSIAVGSGIFGELKLIYVPDTADIKKGDLLVTSGLGLKFPSGYPVGIINKVSHQKGKRFAEVSIIPSAHINDSRKVLLVWPEQNKLVKNVKTMLASSK